MRNNTHLVVVLCDNNEELHLSCRLIHRRLGLADDILTNVQPTVRSDMHCTHEARGCAKKQCVCARSREREIEDDSLIILCMRKKRERLLSESRSQFSGII